MMFTNTRVLFFSLFVLPLALATDAQVLQYVGEGDVYLNQGNLFADEKMYVNAKGVAVDNEDWEGLLLVTDRFIRAKSDYHAHDSHYLAHDFAENICTWAKQAADAKAECRRGIAAMHQCIASGRQILASLTVTPATADKLRNTIQIAVDNVRGYEEKGCPK